MLPPKELRNLSQALHPPRLALWLVCPHGAVVKNLPAKVGDTRDAGLIPVSGRSLEKEMATHFSILAWETPWREELVGYSLWGPRSRTQLSRHARMHHSGHQDLILPHCPQSPCSHASFSRHGPFLLYCSQSELPQM